MESFTRDELETYAHMCKYFSKHSQKEYSKDQLGHYYHQFYGLDASHLMKFYTNYSKYVQESVKWKFEKMIDRHSWNKPFSTLDVIDLVNRVYRIESTNLTVDGTYGLNDLRDSNRRICMIIIDRIHCETINKNIINLLEKFLINMS